MHDSSRRTIATTTLCSRRFSRHSAARPRGMQSVSCPPLALGARKRPPSQHRHFGGSRPPRRHRRILGLKPDYAGNSWSDILPPPCLALKHAKTLDIVRNMPKRLIEVSTQTISTQQTVGWWIGRRHGRTRTTSRTPCGCRPIVDWHIGRCDVVLRRLCRDHALGQPRARTSEPIAGPVSARLDSSSACRMRQRWDRNRSSAACRSSAGHSSRRSLSPPWERGVEPFSQGSR
jgi:hypothetical protein